MGNHAPLTGYEGVDEGVDRAQITRSLARAGCVAPGEETEELLAAARDPGHLRTMVQRRLTGEPLAWITGRTRFCGLEVVVDPGVYVPRWQSEPLARLASHLLPDLGTGVDLCTGSGAVAMVMQAARPRARVVATETDPTAVRCARTNGVVVHRGHLDRPIPPSLTGTVDVMTGVLPYVPTHALHLLPRDVVAFEPRAAVHGGRDGLRLVATAVAGSRRWVRTGGWLVLEVGADQVQAVRALFDRSGYGGTEVLTDPDGDPRAVYGQRVGERRPPP